MYIRIILLMGMIHVHSDNMSCLNNAITNITRADRLRPATEELMPRAGQALQVHPGHPGHPFGFEAFVSWVFLSCSGHAKCHYEYIICSVWLANAFMPQHLGFESPAQAQTTKIQYFWQTNWAQPSPEPDHKEEGANCEQGKDRRTAAVTCPWHCRPLTIEEFIAVSDIVRTRIRMHQHISAECKTQSAVSLEFKKTSLNASDFASTTLPKVCILYDVLYCFLILWSRQRGSQKNGSW